MASNPTTTPPDLWPFETPPPTAPSSCLPEQAWGAGETRSPPRSSARTPTSPPAMAPPAGLASPDPGLVEPPPLPMAPPASELPASLPQALASHTSPPLTDPRANEAPWPWPSSWELSEAAPEPSGGALLPVLPLELRGSTASSLLPPTSPPLMICAGGTTSDPLELTWPADGVAPSPSSSHLPQVGLG